MSSCRGVTKRGAPCSISWGLNRDGYCKFHIPDAQQCLGTSRTTGQRCQVKWDLDASGFCIQHLSQAPTPVAAISGACKGLTKRGTPCSVTWNLNPDGYCKYHVPNTAQCRGLAKATGRRCKIKWGLDERGYCQFHKKVETPVARQCAAVTAAGRRCAQTVGIDDDGFCTAHRAVNKELPVCQAVLEGQPCSQNAKRDYSYCCASHDPQYSDSFVAPSVFNIPGLRSTVEGELVKTFKGRDLYHGDKLDLNTVGAVELDHIVEKQCFAYAFQNVEFEGGEEEKQDVMYILQEEVVNEVDNLCLTRATTNKIKGAAVAKFLDDSMTGHRGAKTFADYLLEEKRDGSRLSREVAQVIKNEMGTALQRCQLQLMDIGETSALEALSAELQKLYVDMDLQSSSSGKLKADVAVAAATEVDSDNKDDEYVMVESASTTSSDIWSVVDIKRTVKVEVRHPTLSADAKPFMPGAALSTTTDSKKTAEAIIKKEAVDTKRSAMANVAQMSSEPTSEVEEKQVADKRCG